MMRVDLLRLMLPPARNMETSPVRCAWRTPEGTWQSAVVEGLAVIAARYQAKRVEVCPHPTDVSMTEIELPPLPTKRLRIAVLGAVELLALASPKSLAVGFGSRSVKGTMPVAWMSASVLSACLRQLQQHGLPVHAVFPPPAFLPHPKDGSWPEGSVGAIVMDGWAVVRTGDDRGILHPVPTGRADPGQVAARLQPLLPDSQPLHWLRADDAVGPDQGVPTPWKGGGWNWTLPTGQTSGHEADPHWLRPAIGWAAATVAVWLLGLNLYASQVAAQGQALTREMAAQVKAAFPEVSVVLNPLKQARQLRDAQRAGAGTVESADFATLVRAFTGLLTQAEGQVQRLDFQNGQLQVRWREGASPSTGELKTLQGRAQERGLTVHPEDGGLRMEVASGKTSDNVAPLAATPELAAVSGAAP